MNMTEDCKVLLVDDEPIILRSLQVAVPWEQLGTRVAGTARNGEEALEIVEQLRPDIIISDIRMPSIDGISLMRTVMEQYPGTLFIILSGYGEFEYAQEAIRHGAFNYLLKPIDHDELQETVIKARERILQQRATSMEQDRLRRSVQSLASLVRERMFAGIIDGTDSPDHKSAYWPDEWELRAPYYMGLVNLDDREQAENIWSAEEKRLWYFAVGNVLNELLPARGCFTVFPYHQGEWLFIMQNSDAAEMRSIAEEIIATVRQCTKLSVSVGISKQYDISAPCRTAMKAAATRCAGDSRWAGRSSAWMRRRTRTPRSRGSWSIRCSGRRRWPMRSGRWTRPPSTRSCRR